MQFQDGQTVGIDLGTTFSTAAYLDEDGNPVAIPNDDDDVETPSLIVLAESGHVIVGPNRMRAAMEDPDNVVERVKREMGNVEFKRMFDGREITPEFLSALILKKLRQDAESRIGTIGNAVITVPYYFNDARRKATQDAGEIAGLNVIDIINEPTAATLTYAWKQGQLGATAKEMDRPRMALIYDLGGGTFDVTVVKYTPTHFQVLATDGDVRLGGVDWNDRLLNYVCDEFKARHGLDPRASRLACQVLHYDCDQAKIRLTEEDEVNINCRYEGQTLSLSITRDFFEEITSDLSQRTLDTSELVLDEANIEAKDLDAIVLVGGSTLMPWVSRRLEELLGTAPFRGLSPYTAVAQGAAIHAAILEVKHRGEKSELAEKVRKMLGGVRQEDVNSHGLGIAAKDPRSGKTVNHVMIPRNSPLPKEVTQSFATNKEGQQRVNVKVIEGDAPDPQACSMLGTCQITDLPPGLPKGAPIEVTYSFDKSGRIHVTAKDKTGGKQASIDIERRGGLTDAQVGSYRSLAQEYVVD